ncbi:Uncharacterised protein r2_g1798 [Pycnogonum litorale]
MPVIVPSRVWAEAKMDDSAAEVDAKYRMDVIRCFIRELKNAEGRIRFPLLTIVAKATYCAFLSQMLKRKGPFLLLLKTKQHFVQTSHLKVLLSSIITTKLACPESFAPCFKFSPPEELIKSPKKAIQVPIIGLIHLQHNSDSCNLDLIFF